MRLSSVGVTVSLLLYIVALVIIYKIVGREIPSSWVELFSIIIAIIFTILLLWIPATLLMVISVIFGYPYNLYAGLSSIIIGLLHIVFVVWTYFSFPDKTFTWLILALICTFVGFVLTYLGIKLLFTYRKRGLVEIEVFHQFS